MGNFRKSALRAGKIVSRCMQCGANGVKLWRDYNLPLQQTELYCAGCAQHKTGLLAPIQEDGSMTAPDGKKTYAIAWKRTAGHAVETGILIPAIPTEDATVFWGVEKAPEKLMGRWLALPLRPNGRPAATTHKPAELMDLMVEYVRLSKEKSVIEKRHEELKEQIDEGLDQLGLQEYNSGGYRADYYLHTSTDYASLVADFGLQDRLEDYKRQKPCIRVSGPR